MAVLVVAACADDTATGVDLAGVDIAGDLTLVVPTGLRERLVQRTVTEVTPPVGPARNEELGCGVSCYDDYDDYDDVDPTTAASGIWNAKTRANFVPGKLSVIGSHEYIGNKGFIETRGVLTHGSTVLATEIRSKEQSVPFLFPPWVMHYIWVEAPLYTNTECGLSGHGNSTHSAWWEAVMGGPSAVFARITVPSNSERDFQPECPAIPPPVTSTGGGGAAVTCYIWITYDLYTGEIYHQELLFCEEGG
jgi:hypothetical protein